MTGQPEDSQAMVVPMPAEIDLANSERAFVPLYATLASGTAVVVADFTATRFCDCASLRRLLATQQRAAAQGVKLRLVIPPGGPVGRLGALIGLDGGPDVYSSLREASGPAGSRPGSRGE